MGRKLLRLAPAPDLLHEFHHGVLRRHGDPPRPRRQGDEGEAAEEHVEEPRGWVAVGSAPWDDDGDVLHVLAHEDVELEHVGLQRDPAEELQGRAVHLGEVLGRVADHEPARDWHPEHVRVNGVVGVLVSEEAESVPPDEDERGTRGPLDPLGMDLLPPLPVVSPLHIGSQLLPEEAGPDAHQGGVLVALEAEEVLVRGQREQVDGVGLVEGDVGDGAENEGCDAAVPVRHAPRLLQPGRDPAGGHGDEETRGVEGHDVVELELDVEEEGEQEGEVVDAEPHADRPVGTEILLDVKVEEISEARHPDVGRDEESDLVVGREHAVVVVHDEGELHPPLPLLGLSPAQELDPAPGVAVHVLHGGKRRDGHAAAYHPEHGWVDVVIAGVRVRKVVAQVRDEEDCRHLRLGEQEVPPAGPAGEERRGRHGGGSGGAERSGCASPGGLGGCRMWLAW